MSYQRHGRWSKEGYFSCSSKKEAAQDLHELEDQMDFLHSPSPNTSTFSMSSMVLLILLEKCGVGGSLIQTPFCRSSCWINRTSIRDSRWAERKQFPSMIRTRAWGCFKSLREDFPLLSHLSYLGLTALTFSISTLPSEVRPLKCNSRWKSWVVERLCEFSHVRIKLSWFLCWPYCHEFLKTFNIL